MMNYKFKLLRCLVAVTILFNLPVTKALGQNTPPLGSNISTDKITLENVPSIFNLPGYANNSVELLKQPNFIQNIERPATWEKKVQLDKILSPLQVTYELSNRLSKTDDSSSTVNVIVKPVDINKISENQSDKTAIIRGNIVFIFNATQATTAGVYDGNLTICIKSIDGGCL